MSTCTLETVLPPGVPGSPGHLVPNPINPNGSSELALWMRQAQADLAAARKKVLNGRRAYLPFEHHRIRCTWPTVPGNRDARFDALAVAYLQAVDSFNRQGDKNHFDAVVQACVNCHTGACTGALAAIEPLRIP